MKQVLILSGKGGTGKTTIAAAFINLSQAKAFADCDVDAPNLHFLSNMKQKPITTDFFGLPKAKVDKNLCISCGKCMEHCRFDAIAEDFTINSNSCEGCGLCYEICPVKAISLVPHVSGLMQLFTKKDVVFSTAKLNMGSGNSGLLVTEVKKQMIKVSGHAPLAIIDGSPGIGCPVIASLSGVDLVLVVAEPSVSGISDMQRVIQTASKLGVEIIVCVNKYDVNVEKTNEIERYCDKQGLVFAGKIPFEQETVQALNQGKSIAETKGKANEALQKVYLSVMEIAERQEN